MWKKVRGHMWYYLPKGGTPAKPKKPYGWLKLWNPEANEWDAQVFGRNGYTAKFIFAKTVKEAKRKFMAIYKNVKSEKWF